MAHHGGSSSSSGSGWNKVFKDFILGGTSGAIAKTLAAPIERVKLLLQTQENNPKLAARPYKGTPLLFQALLTVSFAAFRKKVWFLCGEETGPTCCDTSPPRLLTSQQRTPSIASSSKGLTPRLIELNTSQCPCFPVVSPVALVSSSSIPSISQELDSVQISESLPTRGSSTVCLIAARKSSKTTELKASTKDSECQSSASSHTAPSISGTYDSTQWLRCRKKLHLGIR